MRVDEFDYHLPDSHIALRPLEPREEAKLLVVTPQALHDHQIKDLPTLLEPGDLLIFNDTKVIPARLFGLRGDMKCEVLLHKQTGLDSWEAFARPLKRLRLGETIIFAPDFSAEIIARIDDHLELRFSASGAALIAQFERYGHMPLPPYIERADDSADRHDYQTIFAQKPGAVAAPTASLHFTEILMAQLAARGITTTKITLHVGAGTYQPVRVEDTNDHVMHAEWIDVPAATAALINATRAKGGRIVAVGTTVLRSLESAAQADGVMLPFCGETKIFITPGYRFKAVDLLITNFHLPKSTLLMLVSAFAGMERMKTAYTHAIGQKYRFYSYGDCSLLYPHNIPSPASAGKG